MSGAKRIIQVMPPTRTTKMLGDAGEHYAVSQFTFAGLPATKMPDLWQGYDLAVETGSGLVRVSVKTRSETDRWSNGKWFAFDERRECDWIVCVFQPRNAAVRAWIIPFKTAIENANNVHPDAKARHRREIPFGRLQKDPLRNYEDGKKSELVW